MYDARLLTFIEVAKLHSFTAAAEELFMTPTAVKKQIDSFETALGLKLFHRYNNGVILTEAGKYLLKEGARFKDDVDKAMKHAYLIASHQKTIITIGYTFMPVYRRDLDFRKKIAQYYPHYIFRSEKRDISWSGFNELCGMLGIGVDCIFTISPEERLLRAFEYEKLGSYQLRVVVPSNSNLTKKPVISERDLYGKNIVLNSLLSTNKPIVEHLEKIGCTICIDRKHTDRADNLLLEMCFEADDNKVALTYDEELYDYPLLMSMPVDWSLNVSFGFLYLKNASDKVREFLLNIKKYQVNMSMNGTELLTEKPSQ